MAKNDIFGPSEFANSIGKIIKFQQIQALTSHYENFWSIVLQCPKSSQALLMFWWIYRIPKKLFKSESKNYHFEKFYLTKIDFWSRLDFQNCSNLYFSHFRKAKITIFDMFYLTKNWFLVKIDFQNVSFEKGLFWSLTHFTAC